jgi:Tfp pilus assembly protein PilN
MNEIDFLPEWYRTGRRRQFSYSTQYIALGCMFAVMMVWNFASLRSVSNATAKLAQMATEQSKAQNTSKEFTKIMSELVELQKKAGIVGEIDSKIDVAGVLAEMSFLIDGKIVLSKVELIGEKFLDKQQPKVSNASVVRVVGTEPDKRHVMPLGDMRFKVQISGVAADASDVAALVRKLEDSPYFCQVYLSISRNRAERMSKSPAANGDMQTRSKSAAGNFQVSEFELSCYLANYVQDKL